MKPRTLLGATTLALVGWLLLAPTSAVRAEPPAGLQLAQNDWYQGQRGQWYHDRDGGWRWRGVEGDEWYQGRRGHWYLGEGNRWEWMGDDSERVRWERAQRWERRHHHHD